MVLFTFDATEEWARRYKISLAPRPCINCGVNLYPTIPFAVGGLRGLKSVPHNCGPAYDLKRYVPALKKDRDALRSMVRELKGT